MGKVLHFTISIPAALVAAAVALSALTLRLPSRLVALYYQEQGARALARALLAEGRAGEGGLWLEPEPLTRPDAQALAAQALERFQAAIAADPANFQAHRWLGRAALLLDRPGDAVAAFSAAVRLRPDNPLGWWELGLAYDHLAPPMPFSWGDRPEEEGPASAGELSQPALIDRTSSPPRRIPAVGVEAPAVESSAGAPLPVWGYARWPLPDAPGGWPGWWVPDEPVPRTVLFAAVPATVTFRVSLPVTPAALVFWMGMDPALQAPQGDGVVYRVWVEDREVFSHTLRPQDARAGWWPAQADLTLWAGRTVRLTLALDPGPAGDPNGDWAGWGDAQLVEAARAGGVLAGAERRAVAAWRAGGISAQQLIEAGEEARKAKRYEEALEWYGRAARLEPHRGDPWYYAGLAREGMERWEEALAAYERAVAVGSFTGVHRSSPYYRMGVIYQWRLEPRQLDAALAAYESAIETDDFSANWEAADCHYKRGEILFWKGADPDEYIREFQQAIELNPRHDWAHIRLGFAYYARDRDAVRAETEIRQAIALSPRNKWAYYHLGEVYRQEGRTNEARAMYEKALEIDPEFEAAQKRLESLPND
jgi:tetratricopeptide (TPR) repeat protein